MNDVNTYLGLITSEHRNKEKFSAMVQSIASFYVQLQDVLYSLIDGFDIDTAMGAQLDIIGQWAGVSRFIRSPLVNVYFEWDNADVGWSKGVWQGSFSPTSGLAELPDDMYRVLIKAKIAANRWNGSIPGAYDIYQTVFPNNTVIIQDNQDMSMTVAVVGEVLDAVTEALLTGGYIPLKPEGVRINFYVVPIDESPLFIWGGEGTGGDGVHTGGWSVGSWGKFLSPT